MPYFFIVPAWVLAVVLLAVGTLAARVIRPLAPAFPYAWRVLLWSMVGFVLANALLFALWFVVLRLADAWGGTPPAAVKLGVGAAVLLGPVIASGCGFLGGAALGTVLAWRARRALASPSGNAAP